MEPSNSTTYRFGAFTLDVQERLLTRDGTAVPTPPKVFETLAILVEAEGRLVRRVELVARLWPDSTVEDGTLARYISDLRKILGEAVSGQKFIETVPRVGYRFVAQIEKTKSPEFFEEAKSETAPVPVKRSNWALWVALCALVAVMGWMVWVRLGPGKSRGPEIRSIAVLPILSLDETPDGGVIGQELADAIITRLSLSDRVIRPTRSIAGYASASRDPLAAGRTLKVDAVLDGSIHRQGAIARITIRLIRVSNGRSLWVGTFTEPVDSIFDLEDAVCDRMAGALSWQDLKAGAQKAVANAGTETAKLAYYRGQYWLEKRSQETLLKSIDCYRESAAADPHYARAYSGLAQAYLLLSGYGFASQQKYIPLAREAAEHALALDASLGEAHTALGLIAEDYDMDWNRVEAEYRKAIELTPRNATAHHFYGEYLAYMGHFEQGRAELRRAEELDPTSLIIAVDYAETFSLNRQFGEAARLARQILDLDPNFVRAHIWLTVSSVMQGDCLAAQNEIATTERIEEGLVETGVHGLIDAECGERVKALDKIVQLSKQGGGDFYVAGIYVALGQTDSAIETLNRAIERHEIGIVNLKVNPLFDKMRSDPRFVALLERLHFPA